MTPTLTRLNELESELAVKAVTCMFYLHDGSILTKGLKLGKLTLGMVLQKAKPNPTPDTFRDTNSTPNLPWCIVAVNGEEVEDPIPIRSVDGLANMLANLRSNKTITTAINSLSFALMNLVHIKHRGGGMKPHPKNPDQDLKMFSTHSQETIFDFLKDSSKRFRDNLVMFVDSDDQPIEINTILTPRADDYEFYTTEIRYSYSHIPLPVFFTKVECPEVADEKWFDRAREAARCRVPNPFTTGVTKALHDICYIVDKKSAWEDTKNVIHAQLTRLNNYYAPCEVYKEQARRLIIDAVLLPVVGFCEKTMSVESITFDKETDPSSLGWGQLDYLLYGQDAELLFTECVEPVDSKRQIGSGGHSPVPDKAGTESPVEEDEDDEEEEGMDPEKSSFHFEAKRAIYFSTSGAVQTGSQMLDNHSRSLQLRGCTVGSTVGCLSSGHDWAFFLLDTHTRGEKPRFTVVGEVSVQVFRSATESPRVCPGARRASLKKKSEKSVDKLESDAVAEAVLAAFTGKFNGTQFA